jgi:hypothetical protein
VLVAGLYMALQVVAQGVRNKRRVSGLRRRDLQGQLPVLAG